MDHKIIHEDKVAFKKVEDRYLITTSAWRNANNVPIGGLGLVMNMAAESNLANLIKWNERILIATFNGNPAFTIIVHYSPTEGSETAEEHYRQLANAVRSIPKHNLLLVMGDFNAHIDKSVVRFPYHNQCNNNGKLMADFMQETDLLVTNGRFQKKKGKLWTFISDMSGTKTQIDYILVNKKWKNSIHNCESYNSFSSVGSDHRIVTAKVKMSLRKCVTPPTKDCYNWSSLHDSDLSKLYTITVKNKFESLCNNHETISDSYNNLVIANKEVAKELIPVKVKSKKKRMAKDTRVIEAR